jgi:outer membrane lipopolysaccharide assembly protein LptE/RlpB
MNAPKLNRSVTVLLAATLLFLAGCGFGGRHTPQDCMERAMFFESNRSSRVSPRATFRTRSAVSSGSGGSSRRAS